MMTQRTIPPDEQLAGMSVDDQLAILWWGAMQDSERAAWLRRSGGSRIRDAWVAFKCEQQRRQIEREMDDDLA